MNDASTSDTTGSTTASGSQVDDTGTLYSVMVPTPLDPKYGAGTGGYFRIGAADGLQEDQLPTKPKDDEPAPSNDDGTPKHKTRFKPGIMLYSTGPYQCVAKDIQTTASSTVSMLTNGRAVASAQSHEASGVNTTFQVVDALTASMGNIVTSMFGSQFTHTAVSNATVSMLGRLVCNFGATANVFSGTVVNVSGRGVAVQAAGAYNNFRDYRVCSIGKISFVADLSGTSTAVKSADAWASRFGYASFILNAVLAAATGTIGGVIEGEGSAQDIDHVKMQLAALHYSFDAATGLVLLAQIGLLLFGAVLKKTKFPTDSFTTAGKPTIEMSSNGITLQVGVNSIQIKDSGIELKGKLTASSARSIVFEVADSSILIDPKGVNLEVGLATSLNLFADSALLASRPSSLSVSSENVTIAAERQNLIMFQPVPPNEEELPDFAPLF